MATQNDTNGEVYLEDNGTLGRITCNTAVETHPELSRNRRMVAYSSNETGEAHLWVAWPYGRNDPNNWTLKPCAEMDRVMLTKAPGRDVWPSWVDDTRLVFSSTRSDPLGDIWTIPVSAAGQADPDREARQLTAGPAAETQPEAVTVPIELPPTPPSTTTTTTTTAASGVNVARAASRAPLAGRLQADGGGPAYRRGVIFTTTEFRADGSLGVIELALDASGNYQTLPAHSLWPKDPQDPDRLPSQSSEADYGNSARPFDQRLNYTTTDSDPAGDVLYAYLTAPLAGGFSAGYRGTVAQQRDHAETHGSHYESDAGMSASYTTRSESADASDVVAADGSGRRVVANPDPQEETDERSPTYSPDGTQLAYARATQAGGYEIVVARADGANPQALVSARNSNHRDVYPSWSPDGTRIAFVGQTQQTPYPGSFGSRSIQIADVTSHQVVSSIGTGLPFVPEADQPSWNPDSSRLGVAGREIHHDGDGDSLDPYPNLWTLDAQDRHRYAVAGPGATGVRRLPAPLCPGVRPRGRRTGCALPTSTVARFALPISRTPTATATRMSRKWSRSARRLQVSSTTLAVKPTPSRPILSASTDPALVARRQRARRGRPARRGARPVRHLRPAPRRHRTAHGRAGPRS